MKFPRINTQSPTFIKLVTLFIVLFLIFIPKDKLKKLFSNGNSGVATAFNAGIAGNWNNTGTWGLNGGLIALSNSQGIDIAHNGEIYIADSGHNRIVVLNPDGTASTTFTASLNGPTDVALGNGYLYVTDLGNDRIVVFNPDGTASTTYTGFDDPYSIAISQTGEIYVGDHTTIIVLNPDGTASTTYTGLGISHPLDIAISSTTGYIYIADGSTDSGTNWRVLVLNPNGTASTTYITQEDPGCSSRCNLIPPGSLALSPTGELYVVDVYYPKNIHVFNTDGTASTTITGLGLSASSGIFIKQNGDIYISNYFNINVRNPDGTASTSFDGTQPSPSFIPTEGIDYPGINDNIILYSGPITLTQDQNVHSISFYNSSAILDLNGYTLNVSGDWTNTNGGILTSNGGIVNFVGTSTQKILGENTFENLTKFASTSSTLLFDVENLTTITNNLTLSGIANNLLTIGPSSGSVAPVFSSRLDTTKAGLAYPSDVAFGPNGNIYISDSSNYRIVVLNPDGTASTSYNGDTFAPIIPSGISISSYGDIYIGDGYGRVVVLNPDGTASTSYDGGVFAPVQVSGLSISPTTKEIYLTDVTGPGGTGRIVVLNPDGTASTTYDGGSLAPFQYPTGNVQFSQNGELYLADTFSNRIVVLNPDGTASTSYSSGLGLNIPIGLGLTSNGDIYVSNYGGNNIVVLNPDGTASTTYNGSDLVGGTFNHPHGVTFSSTGEIYIPDYNQRVVVLNLDGTASTTYVNAVSGGFSHPWGMQQDSHGNIYVSDNAINNIQKFDSSGNFIKFFDTLPTAIGLIQGIGVGPDGSVYVPDRISGDTLSKFNSNGHFVASTSIGFGSYIYDQIAVDSLGNIYLEAYLSDQAASGIIKMNSNFDILATTTQVNGLSFYSGYGMTLDPTGNFLYVFDPVNYLISKLNVSDLSFVRSASTIIDGIGSIVFLTLATDQSANLFGITNSNQIIKLSPDLEYLALFAGTGSGDGQFQSPKQVMIDSHDKIYVTDSTRGDIQIFTPLPFTPFQILSTGSTTLSYLRVSGSTNTGATRLSCLTACINMGSNTGWMFPKAPKSVYSYPTFPNPYLPSTPSLPPTFIPPTLIPTPTLEIPTTPVTVSPTEPTPTPTVIFTKNLKQGVIDPEVKLLQQFLNTHGYPVATTGAGSPGHETSYFGSLTKAALIKFQNDHAEQILTPLGLTQGTGNFFTLTRNYVNGLLGK